MECSVSKRQYKRYSREFTLEAIRLVDESGKSAAQVSRELGLRPNQIVKLRNQLEAKQEGASSGRGRPADNDAEIRRLRKELADSREENEFLKKRRSSSRGTGHEVCGDSSVP